MTWPLERLASKVVFGKVRAATGGRMRGAISGGGLMPPHIEKFFCTIGVPILVGYGLTETSPVVAVRVEERNVLGTIGTAVPEVEIQIRDPNTGTKLGAGETGLVFTRGPNVMQGYHHDEALTREVIDANGWFNTGDLGFLTEDGRSLLPRARQGDDRARRRRERGAESRGVGAALVAAASSRSSWWARIARRWRPCCYPTSRRSAKALHLPGSPTHEELAANDEVRGLLHREAVRTTAGLAPFERITRFALLPKPLDVADGTLTQTLKLKRHVILELYQALIDEAYGGR